MPYAKGKIDRNQISFMPLAFDEMIAEDNPVRVLDAFANTLDVNALGFKYAQIKAISRPAYDPYDMIKIYIYGYFNGLRSSRKLEKECKRNIEMMWLVGGITPDDKTISNFRHDNRNALLGIFRQFSLLCRELNLTSKELVAIDGSKFRACNSRQKSYTKNKLKKMLEYYNACAEKYMSLLNAEDNSDITETVTTKEKLESALKRIKELEEMERRVLQSGEINVTDPDCRHMGVSNNGTDLAYNMQLAVEGENHFIVSVDTVNAPADSNQLYSMSIKAKEALGVETLTVLGDKGYFDTDEIQKCEEAKITPIISIPKSPSPTGDARFAKDQFSYDAATDTFTCPLGKTLKRKNNNGNGIRYSCKDCGSCTEKKSCTRSKTGRTLLVSYNNETMERAKQRLADNMTLYKRRQQLAEHPTGTIKRALGYTHYLTKGQISVNVESHLHALAYNLKRFIHIMDIKTALEYLKQRQNAYFTRLLFCHFQLLPQLYLILLTLDPQPRNTFLF